MDHSALNAHGSAAKMKKTSLPFMSASCLLIHDKKKTVYMFIYLFTTIYPILVCKHSQSSYRQESVLSYTARNLCCLVQPGICAVLYSPGSVLSCTARNLCCLTQPGICAVLYSPESVLSYTAQNLCCLIQPRICAVSVSKQSKTSGQGCMYKEQISPVTAFIFYPHKCI